jgi:hypothetical protein
MHLKQAVSLDVTHLGNKCTSDETDGAAKYAEDGEMDATMRESL